jgi:pseudaminic acid synthase
MSIDIAGKIIGEGFPTYLVAELSCNHLRDYDLARKTIDAIRESGADAVKLSTDLNDGGITINCDRPCFRIEQGTLWDGRSLYDLYEEAFTPWEWQPKLKRQAEANGLACFSTPTDPTAVDFLESIGVPAFKVASFEIGDIPLIEYIAAKGKPVILSTGIATLSEIAEAVDACHRQGNRRVVLLKAVSAYPTPLDQINLRTIPNMRDTFGTVVGLSDHTLSISVAVAAVALGARVIEKHFILDRRMGGPDAAFSIEPQEFRAMAEAIRETEQALGEVSYSVSPDAEKNRIFTRSLFAVRDIAPGEPFTRENIRSIRPGHGLPPHVITTILGRRARMAIQRGTPLTWEIL